MGTLDIFELFDRPAFDPTIRSGRFFFLLYDDLGIPNGFQKDLILLINLNIFYCHKITKGPDTI
jgi:hypothetical protein